MFRNVSKIWACALLAWIGAVRSQFAETTVDGMILRSLQAVKSILLLLQWRGHFAL